eukprot:9340145-Alexandrium_andersonii.AAC.1
MKPDKATEVSHASLQRQDDTLSTAADGTMDVGEEQYHLQDESEEELPREDDLLIQQEAELAEAGGSPGRSRSPAEIRRQGYGGSSRRWGW